MARNKAKDDTFFNCSQDSEHEYVTGLYSAEQKPNVRKLLKDECGNAIHYSTHYDVYALIKKKLGYEIPS